VSLPREHKILVRIPPGMKLLRNTGIRSNAAMLLQYLPDSYLRVKLFLRHVTNYFCVTFQIIFASRSKLFLRHATNYFCVTLQIIFASRYKLFLRQVTNYFCVTLQIIFASRYKLFLRQVTNYFCVTLHDKIFLRHVTPSDVGQTQLGLLLSCVGRCRTQHKKSLVV
jgi:hypothetical protein